MHVPPSSPRDTPLNHNPSWSDVASGYAVVLALPVVLWLASYPLVGLATVISLVGLRVALRRARDGLRRLYTQCCIAFRLGQIRVTIARTPTETTG